MASLAIVTACGGGNASKNNAEAEAAANGEAMEQVDGQGKAKLNKEPKTIEEQETMEAAEWALDKKFGLSLSDVKPDYEYETLNKGMDGTMGNSGGGTMSFVKKDGTPITTEDFKAYVAKIYPLAQKASPTGKIHRGQGKFQDNSEEVQKQELTLNDIDYTTSVDLAFPEKEDFVGYWHHIRIYNRTIEGKAYIALQFN